MTGGDSDDAHVPVQVGRRYDEEGYRTFEPLGDACGGCSDSAAGRWVPVTECPRALARLDAERAWVRWADVAELVDRAGGAPSTTRPAN